MTRQARNFCLGPAFLPVALFRDSVFVEWSSAMIGWAIMFLIVALIAAIFAFTCVAFVSAAFSKIVFFAAIAMFAIAAVAGLIYDHTPRVP